MYCNSDADGTPWKTVYDLREELAARPEMAAAAQRLTLDPRKPLFGLLGAHGLFGSEEWWESIRTGKIRTEVVRGTIVELCFEGQESRWGDEVNTFRMQLADGSEFQEAIYGRLEEDRRLFRVGATVCVAYARDAWKRPAADGTTDHAWVLLEMAVSRRTGSGRPST